MYATRPLVRIGISSCILSEVSTSGPVVGNDDGISPHLSIRQYARIVDKWVRSIGLDPCGLRHAHAAAHKASLIYRRTKNLRGVQVLLGHTKMENTVRYLGIEVDDALEMANRQRFSL